jgi:hypothetical protein
LKKNKENYSRSANRISPWVIAAERVSKVVFRLEGDPYSGTCFAVSCAETRNTPGHVFMFATAYHVVKNRKPGSLLRLTSSDETIVVDSTTSDISVVPPSLPEYDIALVFVKSSDPLIPRDHLLPLLDYEYYPPRGAELGWLGYPIVAWPQLCFFRGSLSGYLPAPPAYLIDGVSINGVSGGPAFNQDGVIFAAVQSYIPNCIAGNITLPGLMGAVPISDLSRWMTRNLKTIDLPSAT